ncbi:MAG: thiamine-monophosphate kinase [Gammaproteobacteria bacterium]|jgi:thiamine-monophosphate kinase
MSTQMTASPNEFSLIERFFSDTGKSRFAVTLAQGDDAAIVEVPAGMQAVMSLDTLISGIHFPQQTNAADIAHKALAVNLSDLAAMAATPAWFLLSISLPDFDEDWLRQFSTSLKHISDQYRIQLIGGDTCRGPLSITVQVTGLVAKDQYVSRSGACIGDLIIVSGKLGDAALGLAHLQNRIELPDSLIQPCVNALNRPTPRLELIDFLTSYASAAIDLSDGLVGDLRHILDRSQVGATIRRDDLPVNDWIRQQDVYDFALGGGDDYELCFTISSRHRVAIEEWNRQQAECKLSVIGEITPKDYQLVDSQRVVDLNNWQGYRHFE